MTPILLYSHENEPITKALLSKERLNNEVFTTVSLQELLSKVEIFDEINEAVPKLEWTFPSGRKITNSNKSFLINRVMTIPQSLFVDFAEEDREYALNEFRSYVTFAIESFPRCTERPSPFGLCRNHRSLPSQWEAVKGLNLPVSVPEYFLGNHLFWKNDTTSDRLVFSDPHNYRNWRPNGDQVCKNDWAFAFVRPKGVPVMCFTAGENTHIYQYREDSERKIPQKSQCVLRAYASCFAKHFLFPISETLFFLNGDEITFGLISNVPCVSGTKPWFCSDVISFYDNQLELWDHDAKG